MRRRCLILLTLPALLLTACGGDGSSQEAAPGSPENPLRALPNPAPTRVPPTSEAAVEPKSSKPTASGPASIVRQQKRVQAQNERARRTRRAQAQDERARKQSTATGGRSVGPAAGAGQRKQAAQAPSAQRPCSLVTKAKARAIIGVAILEPVEAPQGPTCIFRSKTGDRFITLTVQKASFARLEQQVRRRRAVAVSDHRGICGSYGRPMLYLPVSGGRVLSVQGPCDTAVRFAAAAVPHL